jgi:hypothetical protein
MDEKINEYKKTFEENTKETEKVFQDIVNICRDVCKINLNEFYKNTNVMIDSISIDERKECNEKTAHKNNELNISLKILESNKSILRDIQTVLEGIEETNDEKNIQIQVQPCVALMVSTFQEDKNK